MIENQSPCKNEVIVNNLSMVRLIRLKLWFKFILKKLCLKMIYAKHTVSVLQDCNRQNKVSTIVTQR